MQEVATAVSVMTGMGLFFATVLAVAYRFLRVEEDPRLEVVEELLPGNNCGACGEPGCAAFAEKLRSDAAGLDVIVTSMIDSAVGLAHAAHVAAACGLASAHGLATSSLLESDVARGLVIESGRLRLPEEPGLGVGLVSPAAVEGS